MKVTVKKFNELSAVEVYEILKARAEIFVVEQKINYQDMDNIDYQSLHFFITDDNNKVIAYLRAYYIDENEKVIKIGRVLTINHGEGNGKILLQSAISFLKDNLKVSKIYIAAQTHARGFYEKMGFNVTSSVFLEAGIPHISMELCF